MKTFVQADHSVEKRNSTFASVLFLLSPILAVYTAFKNYRAPWAKNIIWFFVTFYGYTMVISNEKMDAAFYRDNLINMYSESMSFRHFLATIYDPVYGQVDIANQCITYMVSSFTSNYHVLFAVYGFILGFFYSRNIWYLFEQSKVNINWHAIIFLLVFAIIVGFWNINGFRFWCATHVFFYGIFPYIVERKTNRLWVAFTTVLIHFSFFIPLVLLLGYILLKNRVHWYFYFFILTFFINSIDLIAVGDFLQGVLPEMLQDKAKGYTNPEYLESLGEEAGKMNLYARIYSSILGWVIAAFFIYIYVKWCKKIQEDALVFNLFNFSLFFLAFANLFSLIPSGGRFGVVGNLFAIATIFFFLQHFEISKTTRRLAYCAMPLLILYIVVSARVSMDTIGATTIVGNPIVMFFVKQDWALIELLK